VDQSASISVRGAAARSTRTLGDTANAVARTHAFGLGRCSDVRRSDRVGRVIDNSRGADRYESDVSNRSGFLDARLYIADCLDGEGWCQVPTLGVAPSILALGPYCHLAERSLGGCPGDGWRVCRWNNSLSIRQWCHLTTRWSKARPCSFGEGRAMLQFWIKRLRLAAEMPRFAQRGR
jgi:hypothetical protein